MEFGCEDGAQNTAVEHKLRLVNLCKTVLAAYKGASGHMVPKMHGFMHLSRSPSFLGNPYFFSTYQDETENGIVAGIGVSVHGLTFYVSVFEKIEVLERDDVLVNGD